MGGGRGSRLDGASSAVADTAFYCEEGIERLGPLVMERMWRVPCGEGEKYTVQSVVRGMRRRVHRCDRSRRFALTQGCREGFAYISSLSSRE